MDPAGPSAPELTRGASWYEAQAGRDTVPLPTGVFQVAERLQKRICALCPKDLECSVLYFAQSENIAAHENCLLYSSALVECEDHDSCNNDRNFDVESVKKEIKRGRKLKCTYCGKKGATVGCDLKSCSKNYHFFCAKNDHAVLQADGHKGIYKVFCQQHADPQNDLPSVKPLSGVFHSHYSEQTKPRHAHFSGVKRKRGKRKCLSTGNHVQDPNTERLTKAAAAVQNAVPCCPVTCDERKRAPIQTTLDRFFKRVDRIKSGKEPEPVPSASGVSEAAACPPSPAAADPSALDHLPPPLPPPVTSSSCLSLRAGCYTVPLYFPRSCTVTLKVFSGVLCIIFVKSTIHPL